jgi:phage gp36-like protein
MYGTLDQYMAFLRDQEVQQQSNWEPDELTINSDFIQRHMDFAAAKINGELALRYTVPITPPPPQLQYIFFRITHWSCEQIGEIRETVKEHYIQAQKDLCKIASGEAALIGANGAIIKPVPVDLGPEVTNRIDMAMYSGNAGSLYVPNFGNKRRL